MQTRKFGWPFLVTALALPIGAQNIVMDGSTGRAGPVQADLSAGRPVFRITEDLGTVRGSNLFQSFERFGLKQGQTALFTGSNVIANVISRVTGRTQSRIDGVIACTIPGANLFFINPEGIIFGPGANIAISGSFHATTADYVRFSDGGRLYSTLQVSPNFPSGTPQALGFNAGNSGAVSVLGSTIEVRGEDQRLSFTGGSVSVGGTDARLITSGGQVSLVGMGGKAGEYMPAQGRLADPVASLPSGDVTLSGGAVLYSSNTSSGAGGGVYIRGGRFVMESARIYSGTSTAGRAGSIDIRAASSVRIADSTITAETGATGNGGEVSLISNGQLLLEGTGTKLGSVTTGTGDAGPVLVQASDVTLSGNAAIVSYSSGSGRTSGIAIQAERLNVLEDSSITVHSQGTGAAGEIDIEAADVIVSAKNGPSRYATVQSLAEGSASSGDVRISTGHLTIEEGGKVRATSSSAGSSVGSVIIRATDSIRIANAPKYAESGIYSYVQGPNGEAVDGRTGAIQIASPTITIADGARIDSRANGGSTGDVKIETKTLSIEGQTESRRVGSFIGSSTWGGHTGAAVRIKAENSVTIAGTAVVPKRFAAGGKEATPDGIFSDSYGPGTAGKLIIMSPKIELSGGSLIRASLGRNDIDNTESTGTAGAIDMRAGQLLLEGGSRIEASTTTVGHGGSVDIVAGVVQLLGSGNVDGVFLGSGIYSDSTGSGNAGQIRVHADRIDIRDGATISAGSTVAGNAGNIALAVNTLSLNEATIRTTALLSGGGNIQLTTAGSPEASLFLKTGQITTSVASGSADAGNIKIGSPGQPFRYVIFRPGQLRANAGAGRGGNISVFSDVFLKTPESLLSAKSEKGISGLINIESPVSQLSDNFAPLRAEFVTEVLGSQCTSVPDERSSFVFAPAGLLDLDLVFPLLPQPKSESPCSASSR